MSDCCGELGWFDPPPILSTPPIWHQSLPSATHPLSPSRPLPVRGSRLATLPPRRLARMTSPRVQTGPVAVEAPSSPFVLALVRCGGCTSAAAGDWIRPGWAGLETRMSSCCRAGYGFRVRGSRLDLPSAAHQPDRTRRGDHLQRSPPYPTEKRIGEAVLARNARPTAFTNATHPFLVHQSLVVRCVRGRRMGESRRARPAP